MKVTFLDRMSNATPPVGPFLHITGLHALTAKTTETVVSEGNRKIFFNPETVDIMLVEPDDEA